MSGILCSTEMGSIDSSRSSGNCFAISPLRYARILLFAHPPAFVGLRFMGNCLSRQFSNTKNILPVWSCVTRIAFSLPFASRMGIRSPSESTWLIVPACAIFLSSAHDGIPLCQTPPMSCFRMFSPFSPSLKRAVFQFISLVQLNRSRAPRRRNSLHNSNRQRHRRRHRRNWRCYRSTANEAATKTVFRPCSFF